MKKSLILILVTVFALAMFQFVFATGEKMTHVKSVNAATPKIMVKTGKFTVTGVQQLYTSVTSTGSAADTTVYRFGLYDSGNTYTATAWKVTITVKGSDNENWYTSLGDSFQSTNGSNYGIISGVTFTAGVVLDGGTDGAGPSSVTVTVGVIGL